MPLTKRKREEDKTDLEMQPRSKRPNKRVLVMYENIGYLEDEWHILFTTIPVKEYQIADHVALHAVALLNAAGGIICYGVRSNGLVLGETIDRRREDIIKNEIDRAFKEIHPSVKPSQYSVRFTPVVRSRFSQMQVLEIRIAHVECYSLYDNFHGQAYIRSGTTIKGPLTPHEIKAQTVQRLRAKLIAEQSVAPLLATPDNKKCKERTSKWDVCDKRDEGKRNKNDKNRKRKSLEKCNVPVPDNSVPCNKAVIVISSDSDLEAPLPSEKPGVKCPNTSTAAPKPTSKPIKIMRPTAPRRKPPPCPNKASAQAPPAARRPPPPPPNKAQGKSSQKRAQLPSSSKPSSHPLANVKSKGSAKKKTPKTRSSKRPLRPPPPPPKQPSQPLMNIQQPPQPLVQPPLPPPQPMMNTTKPPLPSQPPPPNIQPPLPPNIKPPPYTAKNIQPPPPQPLMNGQHSHPPPKPLLPPASHPSLVGYPVNNWVSRFGQQVSKIGQQFSKLGQKFSTVGHHHQQPQHTHSHYPPAYSYGYDNHPSSHSQYAWPGNYYQ